MVRVTRDECKKLLQRIAWNLNYKERKRLKKECPILDDFGNRQSAFDNVGDSFFVDELLQQLSNEKERYIIRKIVLEGFTGKDIGRELNMGERGVIQCKNRGLKKLRQYLTTHLAE
jgi:DNA-directed RNA polymerase specialized sigma subunit